MEHVITPAAEVEVLAAIPVGTPVRAWDGLVGLVTASTLAEVTVIDSKRALAGAPGSGPWTYERYQVEAL